MVVQSSSILLLAVVLSSCTSAEKPIPKMAPLTQEIPNALGEEMFTFDSTVETARTTGGVQIDLVWYGSIDRFGPLSEPGFTYTFPGRPDEHTSGLGHFFVFGRNVRVERIWNAPDEEPRIQIRMEKTGPQTEMISHTDAHMLALSEAKAQDFGFIQHRRVRHPLEHSKTLVIFDVDAGYSQILAEVDRVSKTIDFRRSEFISTRFSSALWTWDGHFEKQLEPEIRVLTDSKEAREAVAVADASLKYCVKPRLHHRMRLTTKMEDGQLKAEVTDERTEEERRDSYAHHNWYMPSTSGCLVEIALTLGVHPMELEISPNPTETLVEEVHEGHTPRKFYRNNEMGFVSIRAVGIGSKRGFQPSTDINRVVRQEWKSLSTCPYIKNGEMVRFELDASGKILKFLPNSTECLKNVVEGWKWPKSTENRSITFRYMAPLPE